MMDIPEGLTTELMSFTKQLPGWLAYSLEGISPGIRSKKTQVARTTLGLIKRQISFLYIAQVARSVLSDQNHVACMMQDLLALDLNIAFNQLHMAAGPRDSFPVDKSSVLKGVKEFQLLLQKPASIETFTNWLDSIVEKYVSKYRKDRKSPLQDCVRVLTLHWNFLSSKILHELTLRQARSCGSFIVIHTLCEEYLNLILGTLAVQQTEEELLRSFQTHSKKPGSHFTPNVPRVTFSGSRVAFFSRFPSVTYHFQYSSSDILSRIPSVTLYSQCSQTHIHPVFLE
ncbi:DNA-binding protein RFX6-like [Scyliorhinus canicula]|uniref:DNA-binding protein RFX6-like n=1 Tax=Scyliorhinus canicula TaxID=7830 RepID=UPI0018F5C7EB|nr:DNA-binding protein RFX6-like [Scyliorhinus canicula]